MRLYISGPITGMPDHNRAAFADASDRLRAAGYDVTNPHDVAPYDPAWTWHDYMRADLRAMLDCDGVAVLDGWRGSRGALAEVHVARLLDIDVSDVATWLREAQR